MTELQLWSLIHMSEAGGVALGDADAIDEGDKEMMLGLYAEEGATVGDPIEPGGQRFAPIFIVGGFC